MAQFIFWYLHFEHEMTDIISLSLTTTTTTPPKKKKKLTQLYIYFSPTFQLIWALEVPSVQLQPCLRSVETEKNPTECFCQLGRVCWTWRYQKWKWWQHHIIKPTLSHRLPNNGNLWLCACIAWNQPCRNFHELVTYL